MTGRGAAGILALALIVASPSLAAETVDCETLLGAAEVQAGCGFPVTATPGRTYADYERQLISRSVQKGNVNYSPIDTTECAKRFDAADGRHLYVTIALKANADDTRSLYDVNERVLAQAPDYAAVQGIGDASRRFSREFTGMRVSELEFVQGRWRASLRTGDGEVNGERFNAFCDFATMERLARMLSERLPPKP